jgi:cbb3-type cytochrome c oxidase subunit II
VAGEQKNEGDGMNIIEKFSGVFLIAGVLLFLTAVGSLALFPVWMVDRLNPRQGLPVEVPEMFRDEYPELSSYHTALVKGRDNYVREACWHCHSQFVRPTANEELRYGPVSTPGEYQNILNLPQLFGTRRVGPDLSREAGKRSNDWHYAHLYKPTNVVPQSVMPQYPWYFEIKDGVPVPTAEGKAIVAYLQWLGSSVADRKETQYDFEQQTLPPYE